MALINCRECGKEISTEAVACPGCGAPVSDRPAAPGAIPASGTVANHEIFLLAIPVVGTMLIWFWVANMNLLQSPGDSLGLVSISTVLGTAIAAAMEAKALGMTSDRERGTTSPTSWFFAIALIWIIAYPAYLYKRKQYGAKNRVWLGLMLAIIFAGSSFALGYAIESKKAEIRESLEKLTRQFASPNQSAETDSPPALDGIYAKVASDAVNQYSTVKRSGTAIDRCVQAGVVSAAFLQANDEENYKVWTQTQQKDCSSAGMPVADTSRAPAAMEVSISMEPFTVNLKSEDGEAFLQTAFTIQVPDQAQADLIDKHIAQVRSRLVFLLSSKKPSEVLNAEGKTRLSDEIIAEINKPFTGSGEPQRVTNLSFTSFTVQLPDEKSAGATEQKPKMPPRKTPVPQAAVVEAAHLPIPVSTTPATFAHEESIPPPAASTPAIADQPSAQSCLNMARVGILTGNQEAMCNFRGGLKANIGRLYTSDGCGKLVGKPDLDKVATEVVGKIKSDFAQMGKDAFCQSAKRYYDGLATTYGGGASQ